MMIKFGSLTNVYFIIKMLHNLKYLFQVIVIDSVYWPVCNGFNLLVFRFTVAQLQLNNMMVREQHSLGSLSY